MSARGIGPGGSAVEAAHRRLDAAVRETQDRLELLARRWADTTRSSAEAQEAFARRAEGIAELVEHAHRVQPVNPHAGSSDPDVMEFDFDDGRAGDHAGPNYQPRIRRIEPGDDDELADRSWLA